MTYANGASQSDKNGNLLTETDALGNKVQYAYTPEGWLESITRADGTVLTFEYDKTGSLLVQNVGDGQTVESSYNETGRVTEVSSAEGTIVYQYNGQGYLVSVTNVNGDKVSYTYDAYGNRTSMTYPDGRMVSYTYDAMNRMTSVTGLDGDVTRYAYDAAGRRIKTSSGALTTSYRYDSVGNLLEQATSGASEIAFSYAYNKNGYITGEMRKENGTTTTSTYAYDALGQLTSFLQSTGYGEQYTYDKAGNMTEKVLTGTDGIETALKMSYNKANQLTGMANGKDKITYKYDKNGSMVEKTLSSQSYGKLTDSYAYNALDQLTSYTGYDGYQQQFTYDANGMRLSKSETGNGNRSTLEELLRGNIAGLPEIVVQQAQDDAADVPEELAWATTDYLYDITQEYYQVISETRTETNGHTATTAYAYGLERIAAYTADSKTSYVYDGRGSVAQAVTAPVAGEKVSSALPDVTVKVQSFSYTAFGEQMSTQKVSGFAYNAEAYDAATGMINLRARQYEPTIGRFEQKDAQNGEVHQSLSLNRHVYVVNNPLNYADASGQIFSKVFSSTKTQSKQTQPTKASTKTTGIGKNIASIVKNAAQNITKIKTSTSKVKKQSTNQKTIGVKEALADAATYQKNGLISIVEEFFAGLRQRADKAGNSTYDNLNYWTIGIPDGVRAAWEANKRRTDEMLANPNLYNIENWITSGTFDTAKDAVTVDPSNPGKQWKASANIVSLGFGAYHLAGGCSILNPSGLGQSLSRNLPTFGYDEWPSNEFWQTGNSNVLSKPMQLHHFATDKNKVFTPQMEAIASKYGLNLNEPWNKEYMHHLGRHPNEYHNYVLEQMQMFDIVSKGDQTVFLSLFEQLKKEIVNNPEILTKEYWKRK